MHNIANSLNELPRPYVAMLVGIPGSGKTTLSNELIKSLNACKIISSDAIRLELVGDESDQTHNHLIWTTLFERAESEIRLGNSLIIDATHAKLDERRSQIKLYKIFGALNVVCIYLKVDYGIAISRNQNRSRKVPLQGMARMNKLLTESPPSLKDGFDYVYEYNA